jgi:hypothetical protein
MPAALEAAVMPTFSGPPPVAHVESVAHVAPAGPSTGSVGWSAPTTSDDEPWATLVPPAAPEPVARPAVELESFSASSEPGSAPAFGPGSGARSAPGTRSTIPPVGGANRVIDLTDTGRAGRSDATGGAVPVQWFAADAADAAAATDAVAAGAAGAPGLETLELPHGGPNGALNGRSPVPAGVRSGGGSDAGSPVAPGAIPRRVRGAQLPDLGPAAEPVLARPDDGPGAAESLRWQLRSFQLDVQAARRALTDSDPATTSAPVARPAPAASAAPDQASRSDHHEQADRIHGHDPEGE